MSKEVIKNDFEPKITAWCPFCDEKFERYLEGFHFKESEIECECGAIIEFGCDFWGSATLNIERR